MELFLYFLTYLGHVIYVYIYMYIYIYKYKYKYTYSLFCLYRNVHVLRALLQLAENANPCEAIGHSMVPFQSLYRKLIYTWGHAVQGHGLKSAAHSPFAPIFLHRCCYGLHVGQTTYMAFHGHSCLLDGLSHGLHVGLPCISAWKADAIV